MFYECTGPNSSLTTSAHSEHHLPPSGYQNITLVADQLSACHCYSLDLLLKPNRANHMQHLDGYFKSYVAKHPSYNTVKTFPNSSVRIIIILCSPLLETQKLLCELPMEKKYPVYSCLQLFFFHFH